MSAPWNGSLPTLRKTIVAERNGLISERGSANFSPRWVLGILYLQKKKKSPSKMIRKLACLASFEHISQVRDVGFAHDSLVQDPALLLTGKLLLIRPPSIYWPCYDLCPRCSLG